MERAAAASTNYAQQMFNCCHYSGTQFHLNSVSKIPQCNNILSHSERGGNRNMLALNWCFSHEIQGIAHLQTRFKVGGDKPNNFTLHAEDDDGIVSSPHLFTCRKKPTRH